MLRRILSVAVILFVATGLIAAEYTGTITKADKDGITINVREKGKKGKGTEKTIKFGKSVKITKGEDSVKNDDFTEMVTKAADSKAKGVRATVTTEGDDDKEMVTKISITEKKKKKAPAKDS